MLLGCDIIRGQSDVNYGNYVMDSFEFESGQILENVNVEYYTRGTPKYDDDGNITNAIIYCPDIYKGVPPLSQYNDGIIDHENNKDEYFFIKIISLGVPNSCSPSSTGLKYNFPTYCFKDRVNFRKQFLNEKFKIKQVLGLVGEGGGGFEIFTWACEYPDDMEFFIIVNSSVKSYSRRYIFLKCVESIIESCDGFYSDEYSSDLSRASVSIFRLLFAGYFPNYIFERMSNDELDALMDDYVEDGLFMDIHDFKSQNDCFLVYDVEDKLHNIKAKSLLLGIEGYLFFDPQKDLVPYEDIIENCTVKVFRPIKENYYDEDDFSDIGFEIISFLEEQYR